jgi:cyclase
MNRKSFLQKTGIASGFLLLSNYKSFAKVFTAAGYTVEMLTKEVGIFIERGGTILFYLGKKGITVVDSQFPDTAANLIKDLKEKGKTKFQMLINTHHHGDHTGGNFAFKDLLTTVVAHENSLANQKAGAVRAKNEDKQLFPNTTFKDTWKKKIGNEKVALYYFGPGHTNGDIAVHFTKNNVVHVGDLVFNRRFPFVDKSTGANIKNWVTVMQKLQSTFNDDVKYICGHSADGYKVVLNKSDLKAFENYLTQLLVFVNSKVKEGISKADLLKFKEIPNAPEWKGGGIERSLEAAWSEIVEGK